MLYNVFSLFAEELSGGGIFQQDTPPPLSPLVKYQVNQLLLQVVFIIYVLRSIT